MKIFNTIYRPEYTDQNFKKDVGELPFARVASLSLSLLSLYTPWMKPLSLIGGSARLLNAGLSWQRDTTSVIPKVAGSVACVAGTLIAHPLGMMLTTQLDCIAEIFQFLESATIAWDGEMLEHGLNALNHTVYLSLFLTTSLQLVCLSLAVQVVRSLYQAKGERQQGNYLEAIVAMILAGARGKQLHTQWQTLQYHYKLDQLVQQFKHTFPGFQEEGVGRLGSQWQFPSDHLPVGAKVGDASVFSWNILSKSYIRWVYNDSQGLNGSMLTELHHASDNNSSLTKREDLVVQMLQQMVSHPEYRSSLIMGLQEVHPSVADHLSQVLPKEMGLVVNHGEGLIYNQERFALVKQEAASPSIFFDGRSIVDLTLQDKVTGLLYRVINAHVPGDPNRPGRYEFARYLLAQQPRQGGITIGLGDLNFTHAQMEEAFAKEARLKGEKRHPFVDLAGDYPTNINPGNFVSKRIDGIWAAFSDSSYLAKSYAYSAVQVLKNLPETIRLLTPSA